MLAGLHVVHISCRHLHVAMATWHTVHPAIALQPMPIHVRLHLLTWTVYTSLHLAAPLHPPLNLMPSTHTFCQVSLPELVWRRTVFTYSDANIKCWLHSCLIHHCSQFQLAY